MQFDKRSENKFGVCALVDIDSVAVVLDELVSHRLSVGSSFEFKFN